MDEKNQETPLSPPAGVGPREFPLNKPKNKVIVGVAIGLAVILAAAAVVLATGLWDPLWNPFQPSPEKVLEQAFEKMSDLKTVHSKMIFDIEAENEESFSMSMAVESDSDATDKYHPKSQTSIELSVFAEGIEMLFAGEVRSIDDVAYFKIDTVPFVLSAQLSILGINLDDWTGKWFRFDSKELGMSLWKTLSNEEQLEMEQELQQLLLEYPIVKVVKKLPGEKIEGRSAYHYLSALDQEKLKSFSVGALEILNKYFSFGEEDLMPDAGEEELFERMDEFFEATGGIEFDIWIGKRDKLIYKVAGQKSFDLSQLEEGEEGTVSLDFEITFSEFNELVEITTPKESQSIIELLIPLVQMFMSGVLTPEMELPGYQIPTTPMPLFPIE